MTLAAGIDGPYSYTTGYTYGNFADGESPNRVYGVTYNGTTEVEYTYDQLGRLEFRTLVGAGVDTQYVYKNQMNSVLTSGRVSSVTENGVTTLYTYDTMGNILRMEDSLGYVDTYAYDSLSQLVSANVAGKSYAYTYDVNGNILTAVENGVTHTYTYGNSRWRDLLTAYDGQTITYDQIGNPLTYRNGMRFSWQNGRQLSAVLNNSTVTNYTYNADGTRHSKTTRTNVEKTTTYYYVEGVLYAVDNGDYTVVFQFDETGTPYGFRLLFHDGSGRGETYQYYKYNLQGDVVGIYDTSGNEVVTYTYDPWGKLLSATGVDILIDANPLLYRGYVYDKETGFYYCNSRYYDPETGRWLNADGQLNRQDGIVGFNVFAYCINNPVNGSDPCGTCFHHWKFWKDCATCKKSKAQEKEQTIKYAVPLYNQGGLSLCWAFCQTMMESYNSGEKLTQRKARKRAKEIAQEYHGSKKRKVWNQGGWPSNLGECVGDIGSIENLYYTLLDNGPVYAYYDHDDSAHLVIVTGVNLYRGIVYTNNPWGVSGVQSFKEFQNGYATKWYHFSSGKSETGAIIYLMN